MNTAQLNLFGPVTLTKPLPALEKVGWSHSKMTLVHQCNRAYFYRHYGSKKNTLNNPDYERIRFLKGLSSEHLAAGDIVHSVIAASLRRAQTGELWNEHRLLGFAQSLLTQSLNFSEALRKGARPVVEYPPISLREIVFGTEELAALRNRIWEKIEMNLLNYSQSEIFAFFKQQAARPDSFIEVNLNFELPGVRVKGKIDLAFAWDEQFFIVDWKTGRKEVEETSLQLLTYALWAIEKQGIAPDRIVIQKAYLQDAVAESLEFSDLHLHRARARIQQDAEVLRELDSFGKHGKMEAFTPCNHEKMCRYCPYEKICKRVSD